MFELYSEDAVSTSSPGRQSIAWNAACQAQVALLIRAISPRWPPISRAAAS